MVAQKLHVRPWREVAELYGRLNPADRISRQRVEVIGKQAFAKMAKLLKNGQKPR